MEANAATVTGCPVQMGGLRVADQNSDATDRVILGCGANLTGPHFVPEGVGEVAEEGCPCNKDRGIRRSGHVVPYGCDVFRLCTKSGCSEHAVATLTYEYQNSQVWIDSLTPEREPHSYDLCRDHARRLTAPRGWDVVDRRIQQLGWRVAV